jgi:hypothetical protein
VPKDVQIGLQDHLIGGTPESSDQGLLQKLQEVRVCSLEHDLLNVMAGVVSDREFLI